MKQKILFLILVMSMLCFAGTGKARTGEDFTGKLPSETTLDRGQSGAGRAEGRSMNGGILRAPGGGGSGGIDTGDQTGEKDESATRNDAPTGEAMAALALASIVYGLVRRTRIAKNQLKTNTKQ